MSPVQPRHEHAPRRRADRRAGVELRESHPLGCHPVETGRLNSLLAVTTEIAITEVVGQHEDDVRPLRGGVRSQGGSGSQSRQKGDG